MSDAPDRSEKQFDASPQRLLKAREEGQVTRSRELASAGLLAASAATIAVGTPGAVGTLRDLSVRLYADASTTVLTPESATALFAGIGLETLTIVGPLFAVLMVASVAINVAQDGWVFAPTLIQPKGNRISPLAGFKRLFSSKGVFEMAKAVVKALIVGPIAYVAIAAWLPDILLLHTIPADVSFLAAGEWTLSLVIQMLVALVGLAGADYAFERWKHAQDLKMTRQEVKDEAKQSEGDPQLKGRRRQVARELAMRPRLDHAVLGATVVVTNPTHYAVALRYDPAEGSAPVVVAKGMRKRAQRIKALAAAAGIPTVENVPLARALHATVDEGMPIDESLYAAVAAVLAEVYRRRGERPVLTPSP